MEYKQQFSYRNKINNLKKIIKFQIIRVKLKIE